MKYYICCLTEAEVNAIQSACQQSNFEYGYDNNCLEDLQAIEITEDEYNTIFENGLYNLLRH